MDCEDNPCTVSCLHTVALVCAHKPDVKENQARETARLLKAQAHTQSTRGSKATILSSCVPAPLPLMSSWFLLLPALPKPHFLA